MSLQVGLLDIDICGPSIPKMLGLEGEEIHQSSSGWSPVFVEDNLGVMSIGFMLQGADDPVIWRGPRKNGLIKQFLRDVDWGELDYLVIDSPPGDGPPLFLSLSPKPRSNQSPICHKLFYLLQASATSAAVSFPLDA